MIIYLIENVVTHKVYIGQTTQTLRTRFLEHKSRAKHSQYFSHLHASIRKYGIRNFEISQICEAASLDELNKLEECFIEFFQSTNSKIGYNIKGGGGSLGRHSEETKSKMRASAKRGAENPRYGKPPPNKGQKASEETRRLLSESHRGPRGPMSEATKRKIGDAQKGEKNHRYGKRGDVFTEERLQKMSEGMKASWARRKAAGFKVSDEAKKKISEGLRRAYSEGRGPRDVQKNRTQ